METCHEIDMCKDSLFENVRFETLYHFKQIVVIENLRASNQQPFHKQTIANMNVRFVSIFFQSHAEIRKFSMELFLLSQPKWDIHNRYIHSRLRKGNYDVPRNKEEEL